MTDPTENPPPDSLRALFREARERRVQAALGRRSATASVQVFMGKIAAMEREISPEIASSRPTSDSQPTPSPRGMARLIPTFTGAGGSAHRIPLLRQWRWPAGIVAFCALCVALLSYYPAHHVTAVHRYATTVGQRATLLLDDGTHVMMAPQTTLQVTQYDHGVRVLTLDGDAYFEVIPSARTPFVVQTGATTTRVLGTSFAVQHYAGDKEVRVAVATGKVLVLRGARHPAIPVTAGQIVTVTDSTQTVKAVDNIDTEIGWLGDRLVFQDAPMSKVLSTLTRWYGYHFKLADSTMVQHAITIGLSMHSSTEALASLEQILNVSLTVVGDTVTLTPVSRHAVPIERAKHYNVWIPSREVGR